MGRFLIFFSYLGNGYSGLQTQTQRLVKGKPIITVQDALMEALKHLRPSNEVRLALSSRTDKGVHALKNSCHVDLQYPCVGEEYNPDVITHVTNHYLKKKDERVRVVETVRVHDDFHCRFHAKGRKYVYRLAHRIRNSRTAGQKDTRHRYEQGFYEGDEAFHEELQKYSYKYVRRGKFIKAPYSDMTTALDDSKVHMVRERLDMNKLLSAADVLSGIHNYTAFTSESKMEGTTHPLKLVTIGVKRGHPLGSRLQTDTCPYLEDFEYWDIHVHAKSFLYRMVRRLVGTMVLHAKGVISLSDIADILDKPRHEFPFSNISTISEAGLFLQEVLYDPTDFKTPSPKLQHQYSECENTDQDTPPTSLSTAQSVCADNQGREARNQGREAHNQGREARTAESYGKGTWRFN